MVTRKLGSQGPNVSAIGLGCMSIGIADVYTSSVQDDDAAVALIHRALDLGINLLDTADIYGQSEVQVGKALKGRRDGCRASPRNSRSSRRRRRPHEERRVVDGRPEYVRQACDASLKRLGIDIIDLYYQHRVDPQVPIEETVGAMADLVRQGKVRHLGLSEAAPRHVRRAHSGASDRGACRRNIHSGAAIPEDDLLPVLRELGVALVAYSPLGRGFLAGRFRTHRRSRARRLAPQPIRASRARTSRRTSRSSIS